MKKKKSAKKNFIASAIKHPGALRKELHVKKGKTIPAKKLKAAEKKGGVIAKRARLAETLKKLSKTKHKKQENIMAKCSKCKKSPCECKKY